MRSFHARGVLFTLGMFCLAGSAGAQDFGSPSLLPIPSASQLYPTAQVGHSDSVIVETPPAANPAGVAELPSPSDLPAPGNDYEQAMIQEWGSDSPVCTSGMCGTCCNGPYWFGSAGGLIMTRDHRDSFVTSVDLATNNGELCTCMTMSDRWYGGFDVTAGRMFGCGNWGLAATYWGVYPTSESADVYAANLTGALVTTFNFAATDYNNGTVNQTMDQYFDNAQHHRLTTSNTYNSFELNLLGNSINGGPFGGCNNTPGANGCSRLGYGWMMGMRYFNFQENFMFESDVVDNVFNGDPNEVCYHVRTQNNLWGFQVGGGLNYRVINCLSLYGTSKFGIFNNNIQVNQTLQGQLDYAYINTGAYAGTAYNFSNTRNDLAYLGQIDLGGNWQVTNRIALNAGYRAVGISGVALTRENLQSDFANYYNANQVNHSGSVLLHGLYLGGSFCF